MVAVEVVDVLVAVLDVLVEVSGVIVVLVVVAVVHCTGGITLFPCKNSDATATWSWPSNSTAAFRPRMARVVSSESTFSIVLAKA